jgi:3',5'-cyclic AMP phosphodiesterase CpdA
MTETTRRSFLRTAGLAGAATLMGFPTRAGWAVAGSSAGKLRLVFFTDVHALPDLGAPQAMEVAAKAINRRRPELVIAGGDLVFDGFEVPTAAVDPQWDVYLSLHRAIRAPVEPILGNHDLTAVRPNDGSEPSDDPRAVFREKLGLDRTWRVVDAEGYRIFLLDSVEIGNGELDYRGRVSPEQLDWVRGELERTDTDTPIVVATHLPLLSAIPQATKGSTFDITESYMVTNNREVISLFSHHNLLLVLQGHLHAEEMLRWQGTTYITGGAICGDKWRGPKHGTPEGFGSLTLRPGRVDWEYHALGWRAADTSRS